MLESLSSLSAAGNVRSQNAKQDEGFEKNRVFDKV